VKAILAEKWLSLWNRQEIDHGINQDKTFRVMGCLDVNLFVGGCAAHL
jgi:hypothetical protein